MKRLLVSLLALFIMAGLACPQVRAQSEERKSGDWLYTVNEDGSATITGYAGSKSKLTLPDGLETIGERAFSACYSLTSLTLPESLSYIGEDAFSGCDALELEVFQGSYAQEWVYGQGIPYRLMPDLAL
jgi:hypothetical protein